MSKTTIKINELQEKVAELKNENFQWKVVADLMKTDLEKHKKALNSACVELLKLGFPPVLVGFGCYSEEPKDFAKLFLEEAEKEIKKEEQNK